jgi:hypothetical protein
MSHNDSTYHTLQDLVLGNGGITNVTFIVPMLPIHVCGPIAYTTSSDKHVPVEMQIEDKPEDDLDSIHGTYKVRLVPVDPKLKHVFGHERFYQSDLMSMIKHGSIKVKIGEMIA